MAAATKLGKVYYSDELKALSKLSGLGLGRLTIMQLVYEASACCTSIVVSGPDGTPYHM